MTPTLSDDLRQALDERGGAPLRVVDAATNVGYVILRADQYERVRTLFEGEEDFDPREAYPFVEEAMREDDANDPTLESYQSYSRPKA
jgi:hypothetical protein